METLRLCGLLLLAFAWAEANTINLTPDTQPTQFYTQAGETEAQWVLKAPFGSKVILTCVMKVHDCRRVMITVFDGQSVTRHCGPYSSYVLKNSISNSMSVTITTSLLNTLPALCQATATKPFLYTPSVNIDSSEHGAFPGTRKTSCPCGWTNKESGRIVGGKETSVNEYPFAVALITGDRRHMFCGGSIISPYHILTAAHCTYPKRGERLAVIIGEHDVTTNRETKYTRIIDVAKWVDHEEYDDLMFKNDISIMILREKIEFNQFVGPVCLPNRPVDLLNQHVKVMGWGLTADSGRASAVLRKVFIRVIDFDTCRLIYNLKKPETKPPQICTYERFKDSCQGDSGGPLVWHDPQTNMYTQVALVSFGKECAGNDPAVNTDVYYYRDWIQRVVSSTMPGAPTCS